MEALNCKFVIFRIVRYLLPLSRVLAKACLVPILLASNISYRRLFFNLRFLSATCLEIGGPSEIFLSYIPVYLLVRQLSLCNFSDVNLWSDQSAPFVRLLGSKIADIYTSDTVLPPDIPFVDLIISSNCLEHIANPLRALADWSSRLAPSGCLIIVLPDPRFSFDCNRPITSFSHLLDDFYSSTPESDSTHISEILSLHCYERDPGVSRSLLTSRADDNFRLRSLHHHVFDLNLLREVLSFLKPQHIHLCYVGRSIVGLARF